MKFFITGATGNVGKSIISHADNFSFEITAGVRNLGKSKGNESLSKAKLVHFDFDNIENSTIPENSDIVFLMRPPQITDPLLFARMLVKLQVSKPHIIFLSIQGADKKEFTPHRKIEHQIIKSGLNYTFIRPSYFMENLTTTLNGEIKNNHRIFLPSGRMKLNWLSVVDLGELICRIAQDHNLFKNEAIEVTGTENYDFYKVASIINTACGTNIKYANPNLLSYVLYMLYQKEKLSFIAIMLMLHWLPKFGKEPVMTDRFSKIVHRNPIKLEAFAFANQLNFL